MKTERQGRIFPANDRSASIRQVLLKELSNLKVNILYRTAVSDIIVTDNSVRAVILADKRALAAECVILATGGMSYSFTGSTGDGLRMAQKLGHKIITPMPGLVPLIIKKDFVFPQGLTLKNVRLYLSCSGRIYSSGVGEMAFTHFGISGPLVFSASGHAVDWLKTQSPLSAWIDLKPGLTYEQLEQRLLRDFKANAKKTIRTELKELIPLRMVDIIISRLKLRPDTRCSQVVAAQRRNIRDILKRFPMSIIGSLPIEEAMITRGGICLKDIDPRTMESRLIKGLYFAGEIIDVDADTGGFNLQAAFSTGYLAGDSAAAQAQ